MSSTATISGIPAGTYDITFGDATTAQVIVPAAINPVVYMASGAATTTNVVIVVGTDSEQADVRLAYSLSADMGSPTLTAAGNTQNSGKTVKFTVSGLTSNTSLYYQAEIGGVRVGAIHSTKTFPDETGNIKMAFGSCAELGASDVWDQIAVRKPDFFFALGDTPYIDRTTYEPEIFRARHRSFLGTTALSLTASTPFVYMFDDHDVGSNNPDSTVASLPAAQEVYREVHPHYPLPDAGAIYTAFTAGPLRVISMDLRSERINGAGARMISPAQMAWLKAELLAASTNADVKLVVLASSVPWISNSDTDTWAGHTAQRLEIADYILEIGLERRLQMISGDAHMLAHDDGTNNTYNTAGVPSFAVSQAAPLNRTNSTKGGPYTDGPYATSNSQFVMLETMSNGSELDVRLVGYSDGAVRMFNEFTTANGQHMPAAPGTFGQIIQSKQVAQNPNATSVSITPNSALTNGNAMVIYAAVDKTPGAIAVPAGFTLVDRHNGTGEAGGMLCYKILGASETGPFTVTWPNANRSQITAVELQGPFTGTPPLRVQAAVKTEAAANAVTLTAGGAVASGVAIAFYSNDTANDVFGANYVADGGFTVIPGYTVPSGSGNGQPVIIAATKVISSSETPQTTIGHDGPTDGSIGFMAVFS